VRPTDPGGAYGEMGLGTRVPALIAPGKIVATQVQCVRGVAPGETVVLGPLSGTVTLDGERHLALQHQIVRLTLRGWSTYPRAARFACDPTSSRVAIGYGLCQDR
jgi:hypothetical protein